MLATELFTDIERQQLALKDLARGAWAQGQPDNALLVLESVLSEEMSDRVAAECWTTKAAFLDEQCKFRECLEALDQAAIVIESADCRVKGAFYFIRAKAHKGLGHVDDAITDYSGAAIYLEMAGLSDRQSLTYNSLAQLFLKLGDKDRAREHINQALSICPSGSEYECQIYDTLAEIQLSDGQLGDAFRSVSKALSLVGENELWKENFEKTQDRIEIELLRALGVERIQDLDNLRVSMTRRALQQSNGNLSHAGKLLGLNHKGVDWIISKHPSLEPYRNERRTRLKSIIKRPE